jgi:hypothetical protein
LTGYVLLFLERVEPIRINTGNRDVSPDTSQSSSHPTSIPTNVVVIHRFGEDHIGVRVESLRQFLPVVLQVGLNGVSATFEGIFLILGPTAKSSL